MTANGQNLHPSQDPLHDARARLLGQRGGVVWMSGLSGSGKTTIATAAAARLVDEGRLAFVLDGDRLRSGLNRDLGFDAAARDENIRRAAEVAATVRDAGVLVIASFITPYRRQRKTVRDRLGGGPFLQVFVDAPLDVCRDRDPKGLYAKAAAGDIPDFTGLEDPFEPPTTSDLVLDTASHDATACVDLLHALLDERGFLSNEDVG